MFVFLWYALYFLEGRGLWLWLLSSSLDLLHPAGGKSMSVPFQWVIVQLLDAQTFGEPMKLKKYSC